MRIDNMKYTEDKENSSIEYDDSLQLLTIKTKDKDILIRGDNLLDELRDFLNKIQLYSKR